MKKAIVYAGSYSPGTGEGIYTLELDYTSGRLSALFEPICIHNPSYLIFDAKRQVLYAALENSSLSSVAAFTSAQSGKLTLLNVRPTFGADTCHLCTDSQSRFLFAANYASGSISVFPLKDDGSIGAVSSITARSGNGPVASRQSSPHAHFVCLNPGGNRLCAVDLGTDEVKFYRIDGETGGLAENGGLKLSPGSGPRHMLFGRNGMFAYVLTELSSEIAVFRITEDGKYKPVQYISTLPPDFKGESWAAALRMSPDGRFLYASNRGHDSIALFTIGKNGLLESSGIYKSGGQYPRDIAISPDGGFLLAAHQNGGGITVFRLSPQTGKPEPAGFSYDVHSPVCILFRPCL